jgi:hypothetical protein
MTGVAKSWHTGSAGGTDATSGVGWQAAQAKIIGIIGIQRIIAFPAKL